MEQKWRYRHSAADKVSLREDDEEEVTKGIEGFCQQNYRTDVPAYLKFCDETWRYSE